MCKKITNYLVFSVDPQLHIEVDIIPAESGIIARNIAEAMDRSPNFVITSKGLKQWCDNLEKNIPVGHKRYLGKMLTSLKKQVTSAQKKKQPKAPVWRPDV